MELTIKDTHWKAVTENQSAEIVQLKLVNAALIEQINAISTQLAMETESAETPEAKAPTKKKVE